jgi:hypothetical protein
MVGIAGTYGFETARSTNNSGDLMLREDRHSKTNAKPIRGGDIELATLNHHDLDVTSQANHSAMSSPRNLLTSTT